MEARAEAGLAGEASGGGGPGPAVEAGGGGPGLNAEAGSSPARDWGGGREACDRDLQCGGGMCCAVSLWIRSLRMCTPMGNLGEDCHPLSHKSQKLTAVSRKPLEIITLPQVPYFGRRIHRICPCLPNLACVWISPGKYKCLPEFRNEDVFF
ncbi:prokineticin-2 [Hemicordylus capensis]|uniref:prokineticin-2 n=1 Tax=Hemicordylus capensis TaxID=884348 RepID=UPI002302472D|nr:prokineticin-2 [Hemicordylus capensis]